jgi:acyl-CoA synthetase (AMP-forming)/AMP-acid ligase II
MTHLHKKQPGLIDEHCQVSYGELQTRIDTAVESWRKWTGQPVGVIVNQSVEAAMVMLILMEAGISFLPIDIHQTAAEIFTVKEISGITEWIVPTHADYTRLQEVLGASEVCDYQKVMHGEVPLRPETASVNPTAPCLFQLTSGSNGPTKVVKVPYDAVYEGGALYAEWFGLTRKDNVLSSVPLHHSYGFIGALIGSLTAGSTVHLCPRPSPRKVARMAEKKQCTVLFAVPLLYDLLGQAEVVRSEQLSSLRCTISSGAALPPEVKERFSRKYGLRILQVYGSTETGAIAATHPLREGSANAVGMILPNVEVKETEDGRLAVKSKTLFTGYVSSEEEAIFTADSFYQTSDIGKVSDNEVFLMGRVSAFINVAGRKVDPAEIRSALLGISRIKRVKVIGKTDLLYGQKILAFVEAEEDLTKEEILQYLRPRLAPYKLPHEIRLNEEFPTEWKTTYIEIE